MKIISQARSNHQKSIEVQNQDYEHKTTNSGYKGNGYCSSIDVAEPNKKINCAVLSEPAEILDDLYFKDEMLGGEEEKKRV